jgi:beta-lactam-binding protein with PASTA domain/tRNA A-37 threonylcarbamoyl transferase component Bud32
MTQPRLLGGRYELDGVVGRGGMAEVYRARDIRLDRVVAVKTLREDLARDQTFQARFRREAQSAASLNHPSVVAVYDTGEDSSSSSHIPYIVMEYVDGHTLRDLLRDDRRLLPERALEITDGVLRALDYSHSHGIVHRDIKPGNVMLTRGGQVKVMDFGIARAVSDAQATMTQTAQVIGTAQYLSPEQARGERVDARSDLYSTGCLLYELLTGRPPFLGDSPVAIAYQHVRENPIPPSHLDPEVPQWADAIVLRAMAKDPRDRYQSAAQMRADIQRALSGMPVAGPRTATYGATQRMGPATAMAATPTHAIPGYQYGSPEDGYPPGGRKRRRRTALWWALGVLLVLAVVGVVAYLILHGGSSGKPIPQVENMKLAQAEAAIHRQGLKYTVKRENSDTVRKGYVISTSPPTGSIVPPGSKVTINVSIGQKKVSVKNVVGMSQDAARNALQGQGLQVITKTAPASTKPQGTVIRQDPSGGTEVSPGSNVTIWVSGGGVKVPSVVNYPRATAVQILRGDGFQPVVRVADGPPGTLPGVVFSESPASGTVVAQGSTVVIYVQAHSQPSPSPTPSSPSPTPTSSPTSIPTTPPPGGQRQGLAAPGG